MPRIRRDVILITGLSSFFFLFFFVLKVPYQMDEFMFYHPIACNYFPQAKLNIYREACGSYDLKIGQNWLPLRSFHYVGVFNALVYFPLYLLWPSPESVRILGMIFLLSFVILSCRFTMAKFMMGWVFALSSFPILFQFLVDTGPVAFQGCVYAATLCICSLMMRAQLGWKYVTLSATLVGILSFFAVELKAFYLYLVPALIIPILSEAWVAVRFTSGRRARNFAARGLSIAFTYAYAALISILLYLPIFFARTRSGERYGDQILSFGGFEPPTDLASFLRRLSQFPGGYFEDFWLFAHRIYPDETELTDVVTCLYYGLAALLLILALRCRTTLLAVKRRMVVLLIASIVTMLLLAMNEKAWAGHHAIFVFFPFFLSLLCAFACLEASPFRRWGRVILLGFFGLSGCFIGMLANAKPTSDNSFDRAIILDELRSKDWGENYLHVVVDWGFYYLLALYGPRSQAVLYVEPLGNEAQIAELRSTARAEGRKLLFIGKRHSVSNFRLIEETFPDLETLHASGLTDLSEWVALYER